MTSATPFPWKDAFGERSATLLLSLLLLADIAFILAHSLNAVNPALSNPLYSIEHNRGHAEVFQYIKWFWVVYLFARLSLSKRSPSYLAWGLVFIYFLFDDALSFHEKFGAYMEAQWHLTPLFGLRLRDYGELAASAGAGIILSFGIILGCVLGSSGFRRMSLDLLFLIGCLAFFGIFFDMLHVLIKQGRGVSFVLGVVEDGGEMLVGSVLTWYVFLLSVRDEGSAAYLCDLIAVRQRSPRLDDRGSGESSGSREIFSVIADDAYRNGREFGEGSPRPSDSPGAGMDRNRDPVARVEQLAGERSRRGPVGKPEAQTTRRQAAR